MKEIINKIHQCQLCQEQLPLGAKPILQASAESKVLIVGQAPGAVTHQKGIPFDDKSGDRLRAWLGVEKTSFYNEKLFAIIPMGFCYPGKGKSGDLPPIPLCAETWRTPLLASLTQVELTIILGKYAIAWHLNSTKPITELTQEWQSLLKDGKIVLPHPSPRNNIWLKRNPWFEQEIIPPLQQTIANLIT